MEVLDLYDNSFNKLDQTIVRRVNEIPEGANIMQSYILILNNDKYLLEKSTERNNYKLAIPGGHILTGENAEQGLKRELKEELGLEINTIEHIDTIKFPYNKYIFNIFFTDNKINIDRLTLQKEEVSQVKWYSKDEILKLIEEEKIPIGYAYILKEYMRN